MNVSKPEVMRHIPFILGALAALGMDYGPTRDLFASSFKRDYHTLIPFIPLITIYLLYQKRKEIRDKMQYSYKLGAAGVIAGVVGYAIVLFFGRGLNPNDYSTIVTLSSLVMLWGSFLFAYGRKAFTAALFPLLFLLFAVPVPAFIMNEIITFLQIGSTEFANLLLWVSQVPYYRDGFVFQLPGVIVEVAPQCSGIRSGLALFITALLAGYLFLDSWWRRVVLIVCVFPITMLKNGIRITTLTLLGAYVDPRILQSSLHREGGIPFFILALLLMAPILFFLKRREGKA
ncbi:MAG: exosortase [Syntrophaceae bacterium]|nr:exosortase [Syntrophaceae bacterium]